MQRIGRCLRLKAGAESLYEQYHAHVWPEVLAAIHRMGITNYSIFRHGSLLFSYFELPDDLSLEEAVARIADDEACVRWEALMQTLQESPEDGGWMRMKEVFHVD